MMDVKVGFEDKMGRQVLKVDFPAIEYWKIIAY